MIKDDNNAKDVQIHTEVIKTDFDPLACVNETSTISKEESFS